MRIQIHMEIFKTVHIGYIYDLKMWIRISTFFITLEIYNILYIIHITLITIKYSLNELIKTLSALSAIQSRVSLSPSLSTIVGLAAAPIMSLPSLSHGDGKLSLQTFPLLINFEKGNGKTVEYNFGKK